jgi:hypothetical protein
MTQHRLLKLTWESFATHLWSAGELHRACSHFWDRTGLRRPNTFIRGAVAALLSTQRPRSRPLHLGLTRSQEVVRRVGSPPRQATYWRLSRCRIALLRATTAFPGPHLFKDFPSDRRDHCNENGAVNSQGTFTAGPIGMFGNEGKIMNGRQSPGAASE